MSDLKLYTAQFEGSCVHTLTVDGRPAWIAREIGAILGYANAGKRLATQITGEWSEDFVAGHDFTLLVGEDLVAVKAQCEAAYCGSKGLLVLFESGLHLALLKTSMPVGRKLRRFLVDEVLPQLVRTGAYAPAEAPESLAQSIVVVRGLRADLDDRRFRARMLRQTANALWRLQRIDDGTLVACLVRACEIALGQPIPQLKGLLERDWVEGAQLAVRLGLETPRLLAVASVLGLFERVGCVSPTPVRDGADWTLSFRFSPQAVALIEAWLAEQAEAPLPCAAFL